MKDEGNSMKTSITRKYKPYLAYKDSGVEWLGEIPEGWTILRIKYSGGIRYGIGEPPKYYEEGIPLLRATNVHEGKIYSDGLVYVEPKDIPNERIVWLASGDIIVVRSGAYTGDSALVTDEYAGSIAGFDLVIKSICISSKYLSYSLLCPYLREGQLFQYRMRAAQPHLNAEELGSCIVMRPPVDEQKHISGFLDRQTSKLDALLAKYERLLELLAEKRSALISLAVTKGLDPEAPMKDSGVEWLGEIPEGWEAIRLKYVAPLQGGYAFKSEAYQEDGIPIIKMSNLNRGCLDFSDATHIPPTECMSSFALHEGDILLGMSGSLGDTGSVGNYAIVYKQDLPCQLNQRVGRFQIRSSMVSDFLLYFISSRSFSEPVILDSIGTAQFNISPETIGNISISFPPQPDQVQICACLYHETFKIDALVAKVERAVELLKEYRVALISAAVTGKIDLREE